MCKAISSNTWEILIWAIWRHQNDIFSMREEKILKLCLMNVDTKHGGLFTSRQWTWEDVWDSFSGHECAWGLGGKHPSDDFRLVCIDLLCFEPCVFCGSSMNGR